MMNFSLALNLKKIPLIKFASFGLKNIILFGLIFYIRLTIKLMIFTIALLINFMVFIDCFSLDPLDSIYLKFFKVKITMNNTYKYYNSI